MVGSVPDPLNVLLNEPGLGLSMDDVISEQLIVGVIAELLIEDI